MPNKYFSNFNTIPYETFEDGTQYKIVKDVFKRVRATLLARTDKTIYYNYQVRDRETPEIVSYKYYDNPQYHWTILLMNEIRDPQWQWPLDQRSLAHHISQKYSNQHDFRSSPTNPSLANTHIGLQVAHQTHSHYETNELKAPITGHGYQAGDVVLKSGMIANSGYSYSYAGKTWSSNETIKEFSMYDKEIASNEDKRNIILLRRNLINEFIQEFDNLIIKRR